MTFVPSGYWTRADAINEMGRRLFADWEAGDLDAPAPHDPSANIPFFRAATLQNTGKFLSDSDALKLIEAFEESRDAKGKALDQKIKQKHSRFTAAVQHLREKLVRREVEAFFLFEGNEPDPIDQWFWSNEATHILDRPGFDTRHRGKTGVFLFRESKPERASAPTTAKKGGRRSCWEQLVNEHGLRLSAGEALRPDKLEAEYLIAWARERGLVDIPSAKTVRTRISQYRTAQKS